MRICRVFIDATFDLVAEVAEQPLHRPGGAVTEGADRVPFDLLGDLHQHVDLALVGAAFGHAGQHAPHPSHALPARRTLAAALVFVKIRDAGHGAHDIGGFVHHDHGGGAESRLDLPGAVE